MHSAKTAFTQASSVFLAPLMWLLLLSLGSLRAFLLRRKFKPTPPSPFIYTMQ